MILIRRRIGERSGSPFVFWAVASVVVIVVEGFAVVITKVVVTAGPALSNSLCRDGGSLETVQKQYSNIHHAPFPACATLAKYFLSVSDPSPS